MSPHKGAGIDPDRGAVAVPSSLLSIALLLGGETTERTISVRSGVAVARALLSRGHRLTLVDPGTGLVETKGPGESMDGVAERLGAMAGDPRKVPGTIVALADLQIDVVMSLLHGGAGEGGAVQAILELLGIPFVGSGSLASASTLDKCVTKRALAGEGIPVPRDILWGMRSDHGEVGMAFPGAPSEGELRSLGGFPVVVKPIAQGSTVGVTIVDGPARWEEAWTAAAPYRDRRRGVLMEEYLPGLELTVGILDGHALPIVDIRPKSGFYDFARKYTKGATDYLVPAGIPEALTASLQSWSERAFAILGASGVGRVDYRLDASGAAKCLEVNTIPGMTETSLLPMAARAAGIEFEELCDRVCREAAGRNGGVDKA